jgi:hypothetical protein
MIGKYVTCLNLFYSFTKEDSTHFKIAAAAVKKLKRKIVAMKQANSYE